MRRRAQGNVEYGLLVATIALLVLIGGHAFGQLVSDWLWSVMAVIQNAPNGVPGH
jgi:Flp pilus assembly pilin Flp